MSPITLKLRDTGERKQRKSKRWRLHEEIQTSPSEVHLHHSLVKRAPDGLLLSSEWGIVRYSLSLVKEG